MRFVFIEKQHLGGNQNVLFFAEHQNACFAQADIVIDDSAVADSGDAVGISVCGLYQ